jgi:AraC family transcriptional regulator
VDILLNENDHKEIDTGVFNNQLYARDAKLDGLIQMLKHSGCDKLLFEETLVHILTHLVQDHRSIVKTVQKLPSLKQSTRVDLYKRLAIVMDYLNSMDEYDVDLNGLASIASLSKYHFLRLFKLAFGQSPYQYIQKLKLDKAEQLLKDRTHSIKEIASLLGFENSNSFSRLFYQRTGHYPQVYQREIN